MLSGRMSCGELCQPAPSRISKAMAPTLTHLLISARCLCMASILTAGMTRAAPVSRAGQMAPNRQPSAGHSNRRRLPEPLAGFAQVNRRPR